MKDYKEITGISEDFTLNSNIKLNIESQSIQKSVNPNNLQNKNTVL